MEKLHVRRAGCVEMGGGPHACPVMTPTAGLSRINIDETAVPGTIMLALAVGPDVTGQRAAVRRQIMAGNTAGGIGHRINYMACSTGRANSAISRPAEIRAMADGAHGGELVGIDIAMPVNTVIPMGFIPGSITRMGGLFIVAGLTASAVDSDYIINVEPWIDTILGMTDPAVRQAVGKGCGQSLCCRTVITRIEEGAISGVWDRSS